MNQNIRWIAASLIGFAATGLSAMPMQAAPAGGATAPVAGNPIAPVADLSVTPVPSAKVAHRCWRPACGRRPSRPYYEPYAYEPAYRYAPQPYVYYPAYASYAYYPAYDRPYAYSYLGRYYDAYDPRFYLPGFYGSPASYYYW